MTVVVLLFSYSWGTKMVGIYVTTVKTVSLDELKLRLSKTRHNQQFKQAVIAFAARIIVFESEVLVSELADKIYTELIALHVLRGGNADYAELSLRAYRITRLLTKE